MGNKEIVKTRVRLGMAVVLFGFGAMIARADTLYNDIPSGTTSGSAPDANYSVPFYQDQISAFGGLITLAGGNAAALTEGQVVLSNWGQEALYSAYVAANPSTTSSLGFDTNVTVTLYNVGAALGSNPTNGDTLYTVGSEIQSTTVNAFIAWAPASTSGDPNQYTCSDGQQSFETSSGDQCGTVNLVNFGLNSSITDPASFIYTVSFGTGSGPDDSLNLGLNANLASGTVGGVGTTDFDTAYYVGAAGNYSHGVPVTGAGTSVLGDTGWSGAGYAETEFDDNTPIPEPATFGLIGCGLVAFGFVARKKKRNKV